MISALVVLVTGLVALAIAPATATAAAVVLPDVTVHSTTAPMTNLTAHTGVTRTASCPTGTLVGGGGYLRNAANPATIPNNGLVLGGTNPSTGASPVDQPVANGATNSSNWMAIANFTGQFESGDQATAFALCSSNGPTHTVVASTTTTGANATQESQPPILTIATCPTGTTLIGGGAFTKTPDQVNDGTTVGNSGNLKPLGSYPSDSSGVPAANGSSSATSWSAYGSAGVTNTTDTVTSLALCTSDPILPVQVARVDLSGPDAQPGTTTTTATAACPTGTRMLGGGFKTDQTVNGTSGLQPQLGYHMRGSYPSTGSATPPTEVTDGTTNPSAWTALLQAGGQNLPTGSSMQLHTFALCFTIPATPTPTPTPTPKTLDGTGAETTQFVMDDFANGNPSIPFGGIPSLASYDATGGGNISTKTTIPPGPCTISRPVDSSAGIQALINARTAAGSGPACLDWARSSADNSGFSTGTDLTWVPFAKDGITMVLRNDTSLRSNYTKAFLTAMYNCTLPPATQAQYQPLLPQAGSGIRSTFLNFIGVTTPGSCVRDTINGVPITANSANLLTQPPMIIPHSIGQYYCQLGGACTNNTGNTHLTQINNVLPNISDPNFPFRDVLYNVIPTQFATQPDSTGTAAGTDPDYGPVFVGNQSTICTNNPVLRRNGFAPLAKPDPLLPAGSTGCGDVKSIVGGGTALTTGRPVP